MLTKETPLGAKIVAIRNTICSVLNGKLKGHSTYPFAGQEAKFFKVEEITLGTTATLYIIQNKGKLFVANPKDWEEVR